MTGEERQRGASAVAWLALVAAVLALALGLVAFNRSSAPARTAADEELEEQEETSQGLTQVKENAELAAKRAEAEANLAAIRAKLVAGEAYEDVRAELQDVRATLAAQYEGGSETAQAQWQELENNFDELEVQLRNKSAGALSTLEQLIARLRVNVQED